MKQTMMWTVLVSRKPDGPQVQWSDIPASRADCPQSIRTMNLALPKAITDMLRHMFEIIARSGLSEHIAPYQTFCKSTTQVHEQSSSSDNPISSRASRVAMSITKG